ncbi:MAG: T9SS type A sorting domain-containing protein [Bacteroidota bacterium]
MKKILLPVLFLSTIAILYFQFIEGGEELHLPPTDTILIEEGEDGENQLTRAAWFESMHRAAPDVNWRDLERATQMERNERRVAARNSELESRGGKVEEIAGGILTGIWKERGSNNQAGSVHDTEYDAEADKIWLVSDGGTLFKGERDGSNWEVVNQNVKFSRGLLKFIPTEEGRRLLARIEGLPYYSDDDGITWSPGKGLKINSRLLGDIPHSIVLEDNLNSIFLVSKEDYWADMKLYKSTDNGESYVPIHTFQTNDFSDVKICKPHHSNELYLIEREKLATREGSTKFLRINTSTNELELLSSSAEMKFNGERANLTGTMINDSTTIFYAYNKDKEVLKTTNFGQNWELRGSLEVSPWEVGIYVSPSNPDVLFSGATECHKSLDGGQTWTLVNSWREYSSDVEGKLHADMMYFNEFKTAEGVPFLLVSNHGGLNISYNNLTTLQNIGLAGLNVSQYYSVKSSPNDPNVVFAGSQDQGIQRGIIADDEPTDMGQMIGGDLGQIVFSNNGRDLWTSFIGTPEGSWIFYSRNATTQSGWTGLYRADSENRSIWLAPLMESPNPSENAIYMAGGSATGEPGNFMMKLRANSANHISATQLDFDFLKNSVGGKLSAMEFSSVDTEKFYTATTNGRFFYSKDAGETWEQSVNLIPRGTWLYGQTIYASKKNPNLVWLGGSGYSNPSVWRSSNGGQTFIPMNEGLPPTLVLEITGNADETMLFAATEAGPFVYIFEKERWFDLSGLCAPTQTYWSVEYIDSQELVRFGTYGRGVWDFEIESFVNTEDSESFTQTLSIYPNPSNGIFNIQIDKLSETIEQVSIHDVSGRLLEIIPIETTRNNVQKQLDLTNYSAGIYFLKVEVDGKVLSEKLIRMD